MYICQTYVAVSYQWGDDPPTSSPQLVVVVNGQVVKLRLNLWLLLVHLCEHLDKHQRFWADAIFV